MFSLPHGVRLVASGEPSLQRGLVEEHAIRPGDADDRGWPRGGDRMGLVELVCDVHPDQTGGSGRGRKGYDEDEPRRAAAPAAGASRRHRADRARVDMIHNQIQPIRTAFRTVGKPGPT